MATSDSTGDKTEPNKLNLAPKSIV